MNIVTIIVASTVLQPPFAAASADNNKNNTKDTPQNEPYQQLLPMSLPECIYSAYRSYRDNNDEDDNNSNKSNSSNISSSSSNTSSNSSALAADDLLPLPSSPAEYLDGEYVWPSQCEDDWTDFLSFHTVRFTIFVAGLTGIFMICIGSVLLLSMCCCCCCRCCCSTRSGKRFLAVTELDVRKTPENDFRHILDVVAFDEDAKASDDKRSTEEGIDRQISTRFAYLGRNAYFKEALRRHVQRYGDDDVPHGRMWLAWSLHQRRLMQVLFVLALVLGCASMGCLVSLWVKHFLLELTGPVLDEILVWLKGHLEVLQTALTMIEPSPSPAMKGSAAVATDEKQHQQATGIEQQQYFPPFTQLTFDLLHRFLDVEIPDTRKHTWHDELHTRWVIVGAFLGPFLPSFVITGMFMVATCFPRLHVRHPVLYPIFTVISALFSYILVLVYGVLSVAFFLLAFSWDSLCEERDLYLENDRSLITTDAAVAMVSAEIWPSIMGGIGGGGGSAIQRLVQVPCEELYPLTWEAEDTGAAVKPKEETDPRRRDSPRSLRQKVKYATETAEWRDYDDEGSLSSKWQVINATPLTDCGALVSGALERYTTCDRTTYLLYAVATLMWTLELLCMGIVVLLWVLQSVTPTPPPPSSHTTKGHRGRGGVSFDESPIASILPPHQEEGDDSMAGNYEDVFSAVGGDARGEGGGGGSRPGTDDRLDLILGLPTPPDAESTFTTEQQVEATTDAARTTRNSGEHTHTGMSTTTKAPMDPVLAGTSAMLRPDQMPDMKKKGSKDGENILLLMQQQQQERQMRNNDDDDGDLSPPPPAYNSDSDDDVNIPIYRVSGDQISRVGMTGGTSASTSQMPSASSSSSALANSSNLLRRRSRKASESATPEWLQRPMDPANDYSDIL